MNDISCWGARVRCHLGISTASYTFCCGGIFRQGYSKKTQSRVCGPTKWPHAAHHFHILFSSFLKLGFHLTYVKGRKFPVKKSLMSSKCMLVWYKHSWFHLPCTLKHLQKCYRLSCRVVSVLPPLPHPRGFSFNPGRSRYVGAAPAACPRILIPQHHSSTDYSSPALPPLCDLRELSSSCDLWQRDLRNLCIHLQLERWTQLHPVCQHLAFLSKALPFPPPMEQSALPPWLFWRTWTRPGYLADIWRNWTSSVRAQPCLGNPPDMEHVMAPLPPALLLILAQKKFCLLIPQTVP